MAAYHEATSAGELLGFDATRPIGVTVNVYLLGELERIIKDESAVPFEVPAEPLQPLQAQQ